MPTFNDDDFKGVYNDENPSKEPEQKDGAKTKKPPKVTLYSKVKDRPVAEISKLISVTNNSMQERIMVWDRYRRKYRRGMFYLRNLSNGVPLYFTNYIFSTVEAVKANITRNFPVLNCSPRGVRDDLAADLMSRVLGDSLERSGFKKATNEVVHHGLIATLAYYKIFYNNETELLEVNAVPPEDLLVDPKATTLDNARWIIHRKRNVPLAEIYSAYGEIPTTSTEKPSERIDGYERDGLYVTEGELQDAIDASPVYDTYECWIRCWEPDRENDWYIVTIAGNTVLRQEFSVYSHNKSPFVEWFAMEDFGADNIYHRGVGYIEEIEPLQDRVDALDLKLYKNISLLANRQRFISANSGLNVNMTDNTAGRTYKVNGDPSKAVYYDSPPSMSSSVYEYRDRSEMLIQTVSGVTDVTMGRRPVGITAGRAIESLKESAETRLASLLDTLSHAQATVGNLALQIILQFYDGERLIKSTDGDKDKDFLVVSDYPEELQPQPEYVTDDFGMPVMGEDGMPSVVDESVEPMVTPELLQARELWKQQTGVALVLSDVTYDWDVKANTDSALPAARAERGQIAADLFRLGAIDREALLEAMDFPQRHKILQRLAAEATGKNAGDPSVDTATGQLEQVFGMLQQAGIPAELLQQIMQQMQGGGQPQGGNFPPQITG